MAIAEKTGTRMGDFLEVLELSRSGVKSARQGQGYDTFSAEVSRAELNDETVFICEGDGDSTFLSSEGIVIPLTSEVNEESSKRDRKLQLLHKWEHEMEAEDETTSDEEDSSGCSSAEEEGDEPMPGTPQEVLSIFHQVSVEAEHKHSVLSKVGQKKKVDPVTETPDVEKDTLYPATVEGEQHKRPELSKGKQCSLPGCSNAAALKGLCTAHGGSKRCEHPGCSKKALRGGKCFRHGGGSKCSFQGCIKQALIKGMCVAHSENAAPRTQQSGITPKDVCVNNCKRVMLGRGTKCARLGCTNTALNEELCIDHGGYIPCTVSGCVARARVNVKCLAHAYQHPACVGGSHLNERRG